MDVEKETQAVADMIGKCYDDLHPSEEGVRSWTERPVFDQDLWVWVIDEQEDIPAVLGIAEADDNISEGSLKGMASGGY